MKLHILKDTFSVCKVNDYSQIDFNQDYIFTSKAPDEYSLVCPTHLIPSNVTTYENGWRGFYLSGILDFSLIGILAKIANILALHKISIFVVSTFNTDYIFVKEENFETALTLLKEEGYQW